MSNDYTARSQTSIKETITLTDEDVIYRSSLLNGRPQTVPIERANIVPSGIGLGQLKVYDGARLAFTIGKIYRPKRFSEEFQRRKKAPQNSAHVSGATTENDQVGLKAHVTDAPENGQAYADNVAKKAVILKALDGIAADLDDKRKEYASDWARFVPPNPFWSSKLNSRRISYQAGFDREVHDNGYEIGMRLADQYKGFSYYPETDQYAIRYYEERLGNNLLQKAFNAIGTVAGIYFPVIDRREKDSWEGLSRDHFIEQAREEFDNAIQLRRKLATCRLAFYGAVVAFGIYGGAAESAELDTHLIDDHEMSMSIDMQ